VCGKEGQTEVIDDEAKRETRQIPCNEECEQEKRKDRLSEWLNSPGTRTTRLPEYTAELMSLTKYVGMSFVQKIENIFSILLIDKDKTKHSFPPMKKYHRKFIHALAQFYDMEAVAYDREPHRNVIVTKRITSKIPSVLLSKYIALGMQTESQPDSTNCTLHIYDLSPEVKTEHLAAFLTPFAGQYTLRWIDDYNALAIFTDPTQFKVALESLKGGMFKSQPYQVPKLRSKLPTSAAPPQNPSPYPAPTINPWKKRELPTLELPSFDDANQYEILSFKQEKDNIWGKEDDGPFPPVSRFDSDDEHETSAKPPVVPHQDWATLIADKESEENKTQEEWSCLACTFLNRPTSERCAMCDALF